MLFLLRFFQDLCQRVAEVHRANLAPLGGANLRLVPCPVVPHTAPYRDDLFFQVDVLPGQRTHFSDTKPGEVGDLNGEKRRIALLFEPVRQSYILLIGNGGNSQLVAVVVREQFVAFLLFPHDHILHGIVT